MSATIDLNNLNILQTSQLFHNPDYELLIDHELNAETPAAERAAMTSLGATAIDTGKFTGRSPQDKYVVKDAQTEKTLWWHEAGSDNKPIDEKTWQHLYQITTQQLSGKPLYVMDGFCGANPKSRIAVRLVTEIAWQAHFFKNMFIRPTSEELLDFKPQWTILNACKTSCKNFKEYNLNSETFIAFDFTKHLTLVGGTWYGGEMKKGIFSVMNYWLPLQGIGSFHCSANQGKNGDTALFFGLSGTGKTTLSTDPKRALIGDDEHGWDNEGIFNLEGGCYAKTIQLSKTAEPDIYQAIRRNALLENVVINEQGIIDFNDARKTENTRVSYPINHIHNIVQPRSVGKHPNVVIFLSCDAFGVLPPVSKLTPEQAMYQFLSGYTARVAGTELGVKEPTAVFSTCFGKPFLMLPPTKYAEILGRKIREHHVSTYLVNTGWCGGGYGVGKRISIHDTRAIIDAILNGDADRATHQVFPLFGFQIPTALPNVNASILNPALAWADPVAYQQTAKKVAEMFVKNFKQYLSCPIAQGLENAGPTFMASQSL